MRRMERTAWRKREGLGHTGPLILVVLAFGSVLLYAALVLWFPIEAHLHVPRSNVGSLTGSRPGAALRLAIVGIVLHGAYVVAVLNCWRTASAERFSALIWGYPIAAGTILALLWPVTSTDVFDYVFRGRMASQYGANPYIALPNQFTGDPLFKYVGWPNAPSAYGPLWELMSARMAALGGLSLWRNILLHKLLALVTFLLCGGVIARMTRDRGGRQLGSVLWLWSPLALWEIVAIGHNDGLLILSMLLAIWATTHRRHHWAVVALVIGALFKFLPVILLPLVAVHGMRDRNTWLARLRFLIEIVTISIVLIVLAYLPYWEGWKTLTNIALREKFLNAAPLALVTFTLSQWWPVDIVRPLVSRYGSALLATGILWQMWHIWRHGRDLRRACFGLLAWYLIAASQWFQPWYVLWLLALLALEPKEGTFAWIETWAIVGQASYLLQYFVFVWLKWQGHELPAQVLYLLLIFVPPLVAWLAVRRHEGDAPPAIAVEPAPAT